MRTVFRGSIWLGYGQMYLESRRPSFEDSGDLDLAFAGQRNGLCGAAVLIAAGGTAYALSSVLQGGTEVTGLSAAIGATYTGSAVIDLGPRPADATGVEFGLRCLSAGYLRFPDGSGSGCNGQEPNTPDGGMPVMARFPLSPGQHTIRVEAGPAVRWEAQSRYVNERATACKVNANGQTYGILKDDRQPDLQAVVATNGLLGYGFTRSWFWVADGTQLDPFRTVTRCFESGEPIAVRFGEKGLALARDRRPPTPR